MPCVPFCNPICNVFGASVCLQPFRYCNPFVSFLHAMEAALDARLRDRGGAVQRARRQEGAEAAARGPPARSVFAARIVDLCSWGVLSFPLLQWLAQGVQEDLRFLASAAVNGSAPGRIVQDIDLLASIGCSGEYAANTRRDMLTVLCPQLRFPAPLPIRVPFIKLRGPQNSVSFTDAAVFMPNEQLDAMYKYYRPFFDTFVAPDLPGFWAGVSADDPVARNHPVLQVPGYATRAVPYMVLGDKVQYTHQAESAHVLAWSPIHSRAAAVWQRMFLLAVFPASCCCSSKIHDVATMTVFWKYIALGFKALGEGIHPVLDPDDAPWPCGSHQAAIAGQKIADGRIIGAFWAASSDLEYACNEWLIPHYVGHNPCLGCGASRVDPALNIRDVSMRAGWRPTCRSIDHPDPGIDHPLWSIPGASAFTYRGEWMHTVEEGILLQLHGSCMHDLLSGPLSGFGRFEWRVDALWFALSKHIPAKGPKCLSKLTPKMLGPPETVYPQLSICKAWESKALVTPMLHLLREYADDTPQSLHVIRAYECIEAVFIVIQKPGLFLSGDDAESLWLNMNEFVQHYDWLTKHAIANGVFRYNPVFKLHWVLHVAQACRYLHPRATWTYAFEDFCGKVKKLCIACMRGTSSVGMSTKVLTQWRLAFHCCASW